MALRGLRGLRPGTYTKPPFHTYLSHNLVVWPVEGALRLAGVPKADWNRARPLILIASRLVVAAMFLGIILLSYLLAFQFAGIFAARVIAWLLATSAGLVAYAHFLTADIPVIFWMMVSFWFAAQIVSSDDRRHYFWAGFFVGR